MNALNPTWLLEEFRAFERTLALRTAIEMDLFTRIGGGANTVRALSAASGASERGLRALCDYLTVQGHLSKQGARYSLTLNARLYLTTASPAYFGSAVKFFASDATVAAFCRLRRTVEQGTASAPNFVELDWVEYARSMAPLAQATAQFAAEALAPDSDGPIQVLDLGAGHGLYGLAIAERNSAAQIFALDAPKVLEIAIDNARQAGVAGRYHPIPGDAFETGFGGPYDLVLAANVAHHFDEAANVRLFQKARAALKPAGRIALIEWVPNADRVSPSHAAAFALTVLATSARGAIYTLKEYSKMLRAAGFRNVRRLDTGDFGRWIITASR
ncbi:MAG: class I SAM-dependent methyltransferase [Bryobacteraceae bacterium]|jgi:2-polyprenyl-3-methyl-5-hydroxy-6-metoxy-1,4-benzoquinol methylase